MVAKSLYRIVVTVLMSLSLWAAAPAYAKGGQCASVKTKAECAKKSGCQWSNKACAAHAAGKAVAHGKANAKHPAPKKVEKTAPAETAPAAEESSGDEMPTDEAPAEGDEDF